jgi:Zn-dependent protease with chaperone function
MRKGVKFRPISVDVAPPEKYLGIRLAVDRTSKLMADSRGIWPFKRIVLGASWFLFSPREREAVLCHEAAHCKLFHLEKRMLLIPLLFLRPALVTEISIAQELEADRFAAERGFGVELLDVLRKLGGKEGQFYPSFERRAEALRKIIKEQS